MDISSGAPRPGQILARNALLNVGGQALQLVLSVAAVPFIVRTLGTDRYGILALGVLLLGYLSLLDLGIPRAATKLIAESLGAADPRRASSVVWISLVVSVAAGAAAAAILAATSDLLVTRVFGVGPELAPEARKTFLILSGTVGATIVSSALSGILEAFQRFDLVNLVRIPSNLLTQVVTLVAALAGEGLVTITTLLLAKNLAFLALSLACCFRQLPAGQRGFRWEGPVARKLFGFAGWSTISAVASVVIGYMDRLLIGVLLGLASVTFYSVPQQVTAAHLMIVGGLMAVLFPAFSRLFETDRLRMRDAFVWAWQIVLMLGVFTVFILSTGARDLLLLWMGPAFERSAPVLRLLGVWCLLASLTWLLSTLLQATAFVRGVALVVLASIGVQGAATLLLTPRWGLEGPALASVIAQAGVAVLLLRLTFKADLVTPSLLFRPGFLAPCATLLALIFPVILFKRAWPLPPIWGLTLPALLGLPYFLVTWRYGLDSAARERITFALRGALGRFAPAGKGAGA